MTAHGSYFTIEIAPLLDFISRAMQSLKYKFWYEFFQFFWIQANKVAALGCVILMPVLRLLFVSESDI